MEQIKIKIKRKPGCEDLPIPQYMSERSSGMDIYADVDGEITLAPGDIRLISAGFYMSLPPGYEAQIRPRSGLAIRHGITIVNTPGTIDADYRGLVSIIVINQGRGPFVIKRGNRIAQMVIQKVIRAEIELAGELDETVRSIGGFGHSGI